MCMNAYDPIMNPTHRQALAGISREAYSYSHKLTRKAVTLLLYVSAQTVHSELDRLTIKHSYSSAVVDATKRQLR